MLYRRGDSRTHYLLGYNDILTVEWYLQNDYPDYLSFTAVLGRWPSVLSCRMIAWDAAARSDIGLTDLALDDDTACRRDEWWSCEQQLLRHFNTSRLANFQTLRGLAVGSRCSGFSENLVLLHSWLPPLFTARFDNLAKLSLFSCRVAFNPMLEMFSNLVALRDVKLCDLCLNDEVIGLDIPAESSLWPLLFTAM